MSSVKPLSFLLISIAVQACATPYQAYTSGKSWSGGTGFKEQKIAEQKYLVQYEYLRGRDFHAHYLARRALELCPQSFKLSDIIDVEEVVVVGCGEWRGPNPSAASAVVECPSK